MESSFLFIFNIFAHTYFNIGCKDNKYKDTKKEEKPY